MFISTEIQMWNYFFYTEQPLSASRGTILCQLRICTLELTDCMIQTWQSELQNNYNQGQDVELYINDPWVTPTGIFWHLLGPPYLAANNIYTINPSPSLVHKYWDFVILVVTRIKYFWLFYYPSVKEQPHSPFCGISNHTISRQKQARI